MVKAPSCQGGLWEFESLSSRYNHKILYKDLYYISFKLIIRNSKPLVYLYREYEFDIFNRHKY